MPKNKSEVRVPFRWRAFREAIIGSFWTPSAVSVYSRPSERTGTRFHRFPSTAEGARMVWIWRILPNITNTWWCEHICTSVNVRGPVLCLYVWMGFPCCNWCVRTFDLLPFRFDYEWVVREGVKNHVFGWAFTWWWAAHDGLRIYYLYLCLKDWN